MICKFTHIALHVKDPQASLEFYQRYCQLKVVMDRIDGTKRVLWLGEEGKEKEFILVFIAGGNRKPQGLEDFSHLGFALEKKSDVDSVAEMALKDGILVWSTREEPYPVGYYCGIRDPDGNIIEFSYGQPLGFEYKD